MTSRRALILCATYHQLVVGQAVARLVRDRYGEVLVVWYGDRPLDGMRELLAGAGDGIRFADCHGHRRLKLWTAEGRRRLGGAREDLRRALGSRPASWDVFTGNDNALFFQVALDVCGAGWKDAVLYEEGVGFYAGSRKLLEKSLQSCRMAAAGLPYRVFWRDFSDNRRFRRLACNHPGLVRRKDVEILDTGESYRHVLSRIAAGSGPRGETAVDRVYLSGNFSEARHVSREEEMRLLAALRREVETRFGPGEIHVKFHPLDGEEKRRAILDMGFTDFGMDGPFELCALLRTCRNVFSFRSSSVLNLTLLELPETRCWLLRGESGPARKLYSPRIRELFEDLVRRREGLAWLDLAG
ncbi:hypothetical protein EHM82_00160 [bacterium]|nr:MAG: hypothetical protein EHM82_00160 [bacterium]